MASHVPGLAQQLGLAQALTMAHDRLVRTMHCTVAELPVVCQVSGRYIAEYGADETIHIHEMLLSDAADGPLAPALYSLAMRVGTLGKRFTAPELREALEAIGCADVTVQNTTQILLAGVGP